MAKKQYLDFAGLTTYDTQIKAYIDAGDAAKAPTSHTHDDRYYTESEINSKLSGKSDSGHEHAATDITSGTLSSDRLPTVPVAKGGTGATSAEAARTNLGVYSTAQVDSKVSTAVSGLASTSSVNTAVSNHNNSTSAHSDIRAAIDAVKEDVDTFFADADFSSSAKDTLKEIQTYINSDAEAAAAMTASINGKADKATTLSGYGITNAYTKGEVDSALSAKAAQTSLDSHTGNGDIHVTAALKGNWNTAYTHSQANHAPAGAQANVIETIKVNGTALTPTSKAVNITVPTNYLVAADIANKADKSTTLAGYGITNAYTKTEVDNKLSAKANQTSLDSVSTVANNAKTAAATNTQSIAANTSSINTHTSQISALQGLVGEGIEPVPDTSITALFAK